MLERATTRADPVFEEILVEEKGWPIDRLNLLAQASTRPTRNSTQLDRFQFWFFHITSVETPPPLGVGGPEDDDLVEGVLGLEAANVGADVLKVGLLVGSCER